MLKVKFWVNNIVSETYQYDYESEHDDNFINEMEQDRIDFILSQIETGYTIIKE
jgi:hypothetical protein